MDDVSNEDLVKRIAALEAELAALKTQVKPKEPFKSKFEMQKIDWTEGMRMGSDAAQAMARVVPDVKGQKFSEHAWSQTRMYGPGGFGPPPEKWAQMDKDRRKKEREEEARRKAEEEAKRGPEKDTRSPQTRIFEDMVDYWAGGPNDTSKLK
jgi:hypothetical protein